MKPGNENEIIAVSRRWRRETSRAVIVFTAGNTFFTEEVCHIPGKLTQIVGAGMQMCKSLPHHTVAIPLVVVITTDMRDAFLAEHSGQCPGQPVLAGA